MTTRVTQGNIKVVEDFLPTEQVFYSQKCAMFAENFRGMCLVQPSPAQMIFLKEVQAKMEIN